MYFNKDMLTDQNTINIGGLIIFLIILYCLYRLIKWVRSRREEQPVPPYERVTEVVVQQRVTICKLPPQHFKPDAYLFTITNNLDRGITHVIARHPTDFKISGRSNNNAVIKQLKKNLTAENFIGEENDPRGNRYIWKTKGGRNNVEKQLVTILAPRGKGFELITAYKR
uniref:Uncharacterized protein n=1 Tax=Panagrolaimus davidi TaxID=227884 RepID=A0A914QU45_9BILA